jgi:PAS domain-containing protein
MIATSRGQGMRRIGKVDIGAGLGDVQLRRTMIDAMFATGTPIARLDAHTDAAMAQAGIGLWECDLATERLRWSEGVWNLFSLERGEEPMRQAAVAHYVDASRAALEAVRSAAIARGQGFAIDTTIVDARGRMRRMRIAAAFDRGGPSARLHGTKRELRDDE